MSLMPKCQEYRAITPFGKDKRGNKVINVEVFDQVFVVVVADGEAVEVVIVFVLLLGLRLGPLLVLVFVVVCVMDLADLP